MRAVFVLVVVFAAASCPRVGVCAANADCGDGRLCADGRCTAPCSDGRDCAAREQCLDGACRLVDAPLDDDDDDAGAARDDAGVVDAGALDDAGATPIDGGLVDAGAVCAPGTHDGGDGVCVADGTCSPGYALAFEDRDGDGVGTGTPSALCVPTDAPPPGAALVGGDCDDIDETIWSLQDLWRDGDGDGWTTTQETVCAGDAPPTGWRAARAAPPHVSVFAGAAAVEEVGIFQDGWDNPSFARRLSGASAVVDNLFTGDSSEILLVTDHSLDLPPDAGVAGVEVHVHRLAEQGSVVDAMVRLVVGGVPAGDDRATTTPWAAAMEDATYGGPLDLWGLTLSRDDVVAADFGVAVAAKRATGATGEAIAGVDFVSVYVFTGDGADCDDDDPAAHAARATFLDGDQDLWGADAGSPACLGVPVLPDGAADRPGDCYDRNGNARPGQTTYYSAARGDGSHDYNCDGVETKNQLTATTACSPDAGSGGACLATTQSVAEAACGQTQDVGQCDATCALVANVRATTCR